MRQIAEVSVQRSEGKCIGGRDPPSITHSLQNNGSHFPHALAAIVPGQHANDSVVALYNNQEVDLGEGDNFLLSVADNTEAKSVNGDDTFIMFGVN